MTALPILVLAVLIGLDMTGTPVPFWQYMLVFGIWLFLVAGLATLKVLAEKDS